MWINLAFSLLAAPLAVSGAEFALAGVAGIATPLLASLETGAKVGIRSLSFIAKSGGLVKAASGTLTNVLSKEEASALSKSTSLLPQIPKGLGRKMVGEEFKYFGANTWSKHESDLVNADFKNEFEADNGCGIDVPKDNRLLNAGEADGFIHDVLDLYPSYYSGVMSMLGEGVGTGPNGEYEHGQPSLLASHLRDLFSSMATYNRTQESSLHVSELGDMLAKRLTNDMIQRAWVAGDCMLSCTPNDKDSSWDYDDRNGHSHTDEPGGRPEYWRSPGNENCQAICYQGGHDSGNVPLYGVDVVSGPPWNISLPDMYLQSWRLFQLDPGLSYDLVKAGQLTAFLNDDAHSEPVTLPLLAVSISPLTHVHDLRRPGDDKKVDAGRWIPCSVGKPWGDLTHAFYSIDDWSDVEKHSFLASRCRDNLNDVTHKHKDVGIFYINQCRILTQLAYPDPGVLDPHYSERQDWDNCIQAINYVDSMVPQWQAAGHAEETIAYDIQAAICMRQGGIQRRYPNHGEIKRCAALDASDKGENEGFCMSLIYTGETCKDVYGKP